MSGVNDYKMIQDKYGRNSTFITLWESDVLNITWFSDHDEEFSCNKNITCLIRRGNEDQLLHKREPEITVISHLTPCVKCYFLSLRTDNNTHPVLFSVQIMWPIHVNGS